LDKALRIGKAALLTLILAAFSATVMQGKPEFTKKEKTGCTTCHTKAGSKDLNDVGKCYQQGRSLEACKSPKK
jgi:hypothetical protein